MAGEGEQTVVLEEETGKEATDADKSGKVEFTEAQQKKFNDTLAERTEDYRKQLREVKEELEDVKSVLETSGEEPEKPAVISQEEWDNLTDKQKIAKVAKEELSPELDGVKSDNQKLNERYYKLEWKIFKGEHKDISSETEEKMVLLLKNQRVSTFEDAYELAKDKNLDKETLKKEILAEINEEKKIKENASKIIQPSGGETIPNGKKTQTIEDSFKGTVEKLRGK